MRAVSCEASVATHRSAGTIIHANTTAQSAAATQAAAVPVSRISGSLAAVPIRMLAVAYMPAGNTIIHHSRRNPRGARPRRHRSTPSTARAGMSAVATDQKASPRPVSAG
jgi:hypothetical protein